MSRSHPDLVVMVCRDCCCGTSAKHPRTDHDEQVLSLEAAAGPGVEVRVVDCLDECDRSNVVLLRRPTAPRKERDTWLGGVLTPAATAALTDWITDSHDQPLPSRLASLRFTHVPPRKGR